MKWFPKTVSPLVIVGLLSACTAIHPPPMPLPNRDNIIPGETITLSNSQNVYALSREHNVSMRDVIVLNNLQAPFILHQGQRITLPAGTPTNLIASSDSKMTSPVIPPLSSSSAIEKGALTPLSVSPQSGGTLSPSSNSVASEPVTSTAIDNLNQPSPPPKTVVTTVAPEIIPSAPSKNISIASSVATTPSESAAKSLPPSTPLKATEDNSSEDAPSFLWPVQGPILSSFGPKGQGLNNDGVNIGAPKGSPVTAAAGGTVVYAGNEMKGFGNLILIRHPQGWVTAYAHLDRILVNKDTVVAQGDMIGTLGKSGDVSAPQLHFEIRHNSKPVDPSTLVKDN